MDIIIEIETEIHKAQNPQVDRSSVWALAIFVLLLAMSVHFLMEDPNPSPQYEKNIRTLWK